MKKIISILFTVHFTLFNLHSLAQVPVLWGTASSVLFKINGNGTGFTNLFTLPNDQSLGNGLGGKFSLFNNNGKLYGTCLHGGSNYLVDTTNGVIFSFDTLTSNYSMLHVFTIHVDSVGNIPNSNLLLASDNKFYGTTSQGNGIMNSRDGVFCLDPVTNAYTDIHNFNSTALESYTIDNLMQASNGLIYGTTTNPGNSFNGVLFSYDPFSATYSDVYYFDSTIVSNGGPSHTLIQASDDLLYGLAFGGIYGNSGTLYSFDITTNTFTNLYNFPTPVLGKNPVGSLMQASNGLFYGMTASGGANSAGVIFSFNPVTHVYTKLHDFFSPTGSNPSGSLMQASDGKLYGTTYFGGTHNYGTVFRFDIATNSYTDIHNFNTPDGTSPSGGLIEIKCISRLSVSSNTTICAGTTTVLQAQGASSFAWQPGNLTDSAITVSPSVTTAYTITGTLGGCSKTDTVIVTVNPAPVPVISGANSMCTGASLPLDAGIFSSYNWNNGATSQIITVNTAYTYSVTVTDINSCSGSTSYMVTVNPNPIPIITGGDTLCSGDTLTLNAGSFSQYHWSNGYSTPSILIAAANTYIVTVTDTNGCTGTASQVVTVNPSPSPSIIANGPLTFCQGDSVLLSTGSFPSYGWNNGATTQTINATTSGNYVVTVYNAYGCSATASEIVNVTSNPVPVISPVSPINLCEGESIMLLSSNGILYHWSNGTTNQSLLVNQSGSYSVTVTYGINCSNSSPTTTVDVHPLPIATISAIPNNLDFCIGDSILLTANSTTNITYLWNNGATTHSIEATQGGSYVVIATDTNGCHSSSSITISNFNYPVAGFTYSIFLNTTTFTNTSTSGVTYEWFFGDGGVSNLQNPTHIYLHDSTYTVTLTVTNPCGADTIRYIITLTGINEINYTNSLFIYPNPTSTILTIRSQLRITNEELRITDVFGNVVFSQLLNNSTESTIDISKLNNGIYLYEIAGTNESARGKFVVQH